MDFIRKDSKGSELLLQEPYQRDFLNDYIFVEQSLRSLEETRHLKEISDNYELLEEIGMKVYITGLCYRFILSL